MQIIYTETEIILKQLMVVVLDVRLFSGALFWVFANHIWSVAAVLLEKWKSFLDLKVIYLTQGCHSENYIYSKILWDFSEYLCMNFVNVYYFY